jgi:hypothetical protein
MIIVSSSIWRISFDYRVRLLALPVQSFHQVGNSLWKSRLEKQIFIKEVSRVESRLLLDIF